MRVAFYNANFVCGDPETLFKKICSQWIFQIPSGNEFLAANFLLTLKPG
jgi:hypothetical protein